jgi:leucine dehydrogenase
MPDYLNRMQEQEFESVTFVYDAETGLKALVAIHNTNRGPALGGTRMWTYPDEAAAIDDVMCLARGMSYKSAAAELPLGGGKAVIIGDPCNDKSEQLFKAYGRAVERLNGRFITAADMGIEEADLDLIRSVTGHVVGGSEIGSPSPFTAYGVWRGIKAAVREVFGTADLKGLTIAVQGIGTVGYALCKHLADEGSKLIVADLDQEKADRAVFDFNAETVAVDQIFNCQCDIIAPCAGGGAICNATEPLLKCKIVAGAANNVLRDNLVGKKLKDRGILYAPDYIINAGGIIFVEKRRQGIWNDSEIINHIALIEERLQEIFNQAREQDLQPEVVADLYAEEKLKEKTDW